MDNSKHEEDESELDELKERMEQLRTLEDQCQSAALRMAQAKQELKDAKEEYDGAVVALRRVIRARELDADRPLFNLPSSSSEPDAWRSVSIDELGLSPKICEALRDHSPTLETVGAIDRGGVTMNTETYRILSYAFVFIGGGIFVWLLIVMLRMCSEKPETDWLDEEAR